MENLLKTNLFVARDLCSIEVINDHKYIEQTKGYFTVRFIVTTKSNSNINGRSLK